MKISASNLRSLGSDLFWIEGRPELGGRRLVVRWSDGGTPEIISPGDLSLSSRVHEYGGGEMAVVDHDGPLVVGVRASDQALVAFRPGDRAEAVLCAPTAGRALGDLAPVPGAPWVLAVSEEGVGGRTERSVVAVSLNHQPPITIREGRDFFAGAKVAPGGDALVWSCWDHPAMPWEASEVWWAPVVDEASMTLGEPIKLAGGPDGPAGYPAFDDDGSVVMIAEIEGWARPVRWRPGGPLEGLGEEGVEFGCPLWVLGEVQLVAGGGHLVAVEHRDGLTRVVDVGDGSSLPLDLEATAVSGLALASGDVAWLGPTPTRLGAVARMRRWGAGERTVIPLGPRSPLDDRDVSLPVAVAAEGGDGRRIHGLLYRPSSNIATGPEGVAPPVVVFCHGGPTGQARAGFDATIQLLTSRGFAVVAANYAGSTGYGAAYRHRLDGAWGIADVADCVDLVAWLGALGEVDPDRAAIRGSSAGGFTALLGVTTGAFRGAVSWYGVANLLTLAESTHDFESHYLDTLVGPLPSAVGRYVERSPVSRAEEMTGAVLLLQGLDDPVVPPEQAETMTAALRARGQEVELITFEGESHGFRRLETLVAAFDAEIAFYERHLCHEAPVRGR